MNPSGKVLYKYSLSCFICRFSLEFYVAYLHRFEPPGKMSPGMSCEVGVTFKPAVSAPK